MVIASLPVIIQYHIQNIIYHQENLISWLSKKQQTVALSTAESDYVSAATCASELLFVRGLTFDFSKKCYIELYVGRPGVFILF